MRRVRDSNPRYSFKYTRFPSVLHKPLGQLSSYLLRREEELNPIPVGTTRLAGGPNHQISLLSIGGRGNRTPKAFRPSRFQGGVLVHSDSFRLRRGEVSIPIPVGTTSFQD